MRPDEEARALLYQRQQANRAAHLATIAASLSGQSAYRQTLDEDWAPLVLARQEALALADPADCEADA